MSANKEWKKVRRSFFHPRSTKTGTYNQGRRPRSHRCPTRQWMSEFEIARETTMLLPTLWLAMAVAKADTLSQVTYYGGPVVSNAHVNVVFWGGGITAQLQTQL